eukprot:4941103-Pleurochrysis_carterae.AAC.1
MRALPQSLQPSSDGGCECCRGCCEAPHAAAKFYDERCRARTALPTCELPVLEHSFPPCPSCMQLRAQHAA